MRIQLVLHYEGSGFHGWQVQPGFRTVQGEIEAVVERLTGSHRTVLGSGRTDAGVHATGQVASVTFPRRWHAAQVRKSLNALLPRDIWVESAREVSSGFHPRYQATARSYSYRVGTIDAAASPFHRPYCWALCETLEPTRLAEAAAALPGRHSFRAFAKAGQPHRGEHCVVEAAEWRPWPGLGYTFSITANRFLHHMVRYLVGTMVDIGLGRREVGELVALLEDPDAEGVTSPPAPPEGLYLERVHYGAPSETSPVTSPTHP